MAGYLMQAGPCVAGMHGPEPITATALRDWCELVAVPLTPWQAETILAASRAYADQARDEKAPAPWQVVADKLRLAEAIKGALRGRRQSSG